MPDQDPKDMTPEDVKRYGKQVERGIKTNQEIKKTLDEADKKLEEARELLKKHDKNKK